MKRMTAAVAAAIAASAAIPALAATWTDPSTGIEWTYNVISGEAEIYSEWHKSAIPATTTGAVTVPSTLGGYPVRRIENWAFYGCTNITSVTIPNSVTRIGNSAFEGCSAMSSVTIPSSVIELGAHAFSECSALTEVTIPSSVTNINKYLFSECTSLSSVTIPDSVTNIGQYAFAECTSLAGVTLPAGLTSLGQYAFNYCTSLGGTIAIPDGVTEIGSYAFEDCKIEEVTMGRGVKKIREYAFFNCTALWTVVLGRNVAEIEGHAFAKCKNMHNLTVYPSVKSIAYYAFWNANFNNIYVARGDSERIRQMLLEATKSGPDGSRLYDGTIYPKEFDYWDGDLSTLNYDAVADNGTVIAGPLYGCHKVAIADGATVTLRDVDISGVHNLDYKYAGIMCEGNATIILEGANVVKGYYKDYPGIYVPPGKKLTIKGDGSLTASSSGRGAGIGGGYEIGCGQIDIEGGSVTATGGEYAAGIGSGYNADCGNILIKPGITHVTATHGANGVKPIGNGAGGESAGYNAYGLSVKTVGATLYISPGTISGPDEISGAGETVLQDGDILTGEITGKRKISIAAGATVTLSDVTLDGLNEGGYVNTVWAGITCLGNAVIILEGGNYVAGYNQYQPGIHVPVGSTLTIKGGGSLTAEGAERAAGIGGAWKLACGNIVIESGHVEAHGGSDAAGIGGGFIGACGDIAIEGGYVWATGGKDAAGIGSGSFSSCGNITITGGEVAATGNGYAAGIGGGNGGEIGSIYIGEGIVRVAATRGGSTGRDPIGGENGTVTISESLGDTLMDDGATRIIAPFVTVTFDANGGTVSPTTRKVVKGTYIGELPEPNKLGYNFAGWYSNPLFNFDAAKETDIASANLRLYAKWAELPIPSIDAGEYFKATLAELGYDVPTNGTPYSVKALGLPAGLKLKYNAAVTKTVKGKKVVVTKAKSTWWIEGVPTAALDYETAPSYLVITANGRTDTVPLLLQVAAQDVTELAPLALGDAVNQQYFLPGVDTAAWTVTGLPTGLKYTAKAIYKDPKAKKKVVKYPAFTVYGKTTKAGRFTITAKKKKGAFYETLKFRLEVEPKAVDAALFGTLGGRVDTAHVAIADWNLKNDVASVGGNVAKVTGLPPGLTFAAKDTYAYTNPKKQTGKYLKQTGQTIVGTPTKAGKYLVTFTKNEKVGKKTVARTAQVWWNVLANPSAPVLDFNTGGGEVEECALGVKYGTGTALLSFYVAAGTTVTASGMPKGVKFTDLGGGVWGFTGYSTKAGTYLVTVKATLNGNTVTQRVALKVNALPAWAKGSFNGGVMKYSDYSYCGLATVSVTSAGKISGKLFYDDGDGKPKTWTFSAPCFSAGSADEYSVDVTAKYAYKVKVKVKGKWTTVTKYLERPFSITVEPGWGTGGGVSIRSDWNDSQIGEYGERVYAYAVQNLWGSTYKTIGAKVFYTSKKAKYKVYKYTVDVGGKSCALSVKVTPNGKATATLTYDTGKKSKGKTVYYKPTCSTVVIPHTTPEYYSQSKQFSGEVDLYFAPSAGNNFPGWGGYEMVP